MLGIVWAPSALRIPISRARFETAKAMTAYSPRLASPSPRGRRYQVKANRPSGKPGSRVTLVPKPKNYEWDYLIWILYNKGYEIEEAWQWDVTSFKQTFHQKKRLSPSDYRSGTRLA